MSLFFPQGLVALPPDDCIADARVPWTTIAINAACSLTSHALVYGVVGGAITDDISFSGSITRTLSRVKYHGLQPSTDIGSDKFRVSQTGCCNGRLAVDFFLDPQDGPTDFPSTAVGVPVGGAWSRHYDPLYTSLTDTGGTIDSAGAGPKVGGGFHDLTVDPDALCAQRGDAEPPTNSADARIQLTFTGLNALMESLGAVLPSNATDGAWVGTVTTSNGIDAPDVQTYDGIGSLDFVKTLAFRPFAPSATYTLSAALTIALDTGSTRQGTAAFSFTLSAAFSLKALRIDIAAAA